MLGGRLPSVSAAGEQSCRASLTSRPRASSLRALSRNKKGFVLKILHTEEYQLRQTTMYPSVRKRGRRILKKGWWREKIARAQATIRTNFPTVDQSGRAVAICLSIAITHWAFLGARQLAGVTCSALPRREGDRCQCDLCPTGCATEESSFLLARKSMLGLAATLDIPRAPTSEVLAGGCC